MQHSCALKQQLSALLVRQPGSNRHRRRQPHARGQITCLAGKSEVTSYVAGARKQIVQHDDSCFDDESWSKADESRASTDRRGLIRGAISATLASTAPAILPKVVNAPSADAAPLAFQGPPVARAPLGSDIPPGIAAVRDPALYRLTCRMAYRCS